MGESIPYRPRSLLDCDRTDQDRIGLGDRPLVFTNLLVGNASQAPLGLLEFVEVIIIASSSSFHLVLDAVGSRSQRP